MSKRISEEIKNKIPDLYQLGKNDRQIAKELGISPPSVKSWRYENNLKSNFKNINRRKEVFDLGVLGFSRLEITEKTGLTYKAVCNYLTQTEIIDLVKTQYELNQPTFSQDHLEYLFGTIMGDGCMFKTKTAVGCTITHSIKQEEYVRFKQNLLKDVANEIKIRNYYYKPYNKFYKNCGFTIRHSHSKLDDLYYSFYPNGVKVIPEDLSLLTPKAIALWYMDDGSNMKSGYLFCTHSFTIDDAHRCASFLKTKYGLEINVHIRKNQPVLYLRSKSVKSFNDLVLPYFCESMKYKLILNKKGRCFTK